MAPGLYDGFEGFRTASTKEQRKAVGSWLVVLDTNVLLNLYGYQGSALDDFINVFEALGERLFVPHQVMDEFWRNRRIVLQGNQGKHREREEAEKGFDDVERALRRWHQRVVERAGQPEPGVLERVHIARAAVLDLMARKNAEARITLPDTPTHEDRVLVRLQNLLRDRVGEPPADADMDALRAEGNMRIMQRTPPGYLDGDKNPDRAIGDFLVWRQAMEESKRRESPVLLVTQDQKDDWWADSKSDSRRARPELVSELLAFSGQPLLMMRAHDLLALGDVLGVQVSRATVEEAEEVSQESEADDDQQPELSRTKLLYREFWTQFEPIARQRGWLGRRTSTPSVNWWSMPAGGGGNVWGVSYASFGCRTELYLGNGNPQVNLHRLRLLQERAEEIQRAFGGGDVVQFDELPHAQSCRIEVRNEDGRVIEDRTTWQDTLNWMVDRHERLRHAIDSVGGVPLSVPETIHD